MKMNFFTGQKGRAKKDVRESWKSVEEELHKLLKANYDENRTPTRAEAIRAIEESKKNGGKLQFRNYRNVVKKVSTDLIAKKAKE